MKIKFLNINKLRKVSISEQSKKKNIKNATNILNYLLKTKYNYLFNWLGIPVIQLPNDLMVIQELIFEEKPDLILECGIGHGGMLVYFASLLKLMKKQFKIVGVDVLIRNINKKKIQSHFLSKHIDLYQFSSVDEKFIQLFKKKYLKKNKKTIIFLDSNHTKDHVLNELYLYSKLLKKGDFIIVMDTVIELIDQKYTKGKSFSKGNSPMNAVQVFLKSNKNFKNINLYENKSFLTVARNGFLKKTK